MILHSTARLTALPAYREVSLEEAIYIIQLSPPLGRLGFVYPFSIR